VRWLDVHPTRAARILPTRPTLPRFPYSPVSSGTLPQQHSARGSCGTLTRHAQLEHTHRYPCFGHDTKARVRRESKARAPRDTHRTCVSLHHHTRAGASGLATDASPPTAQAHTFSATWSRHTRLSDTHTRTHTHTHTTRARTHTRARTRTRARARTTRTHSRTRTRLSATHGARVSRLTASVARPSSTCSTAGGPSRSTLVSTASADGETVNQPSSSEEPPFSIERRSTAIN